MVFLFYFCEQKINKYYLLKITENSKNEKLVKIQKKSKYKTKKKEKIENS